MSPSSSTKWANARAFNASMIMSWLSGCGADMLLILGAVLPVMATPSRGPGFASQVGRAVGYRCCIRPFGPRREAEAGPGAGRHDRQDRPLDRGEVALGCDRGHEPVVQVRRIGEGVGEPGG